jgi:hypothetical protein
VFDRWPHEMVAKVSRWVCPKALVLPMAIVRSAK